MSISSASIRLAAVAAVTTLAAGGWWVTTHPTNARLLVASVERPRSETGAVERSGPAHALIAAARAQEGVTTIYDGAYAAIAYPMGDVDRSRGVCTDVVVRAYRDAFGIDLQKLVHEDMTRAFSLYPKRWGLATPDANIDHRRVPNLQVFFSRHGRTLPVSAEPRDYRPGDIVTQTVDGNRPHVVLVTGLLSDDGMRPLVVHNIGRGTRLQDSLFAFPITGHYRFGPTAAAETGS